MLNSLESDSFINALMRFSARRGHPEQIRCDNGTNFKGASNELKMDKWSDQIEQRLTKQGIKWTFNTPHASHQGGAWERIIRAARRILAALIGKTVLDDERLSTIFCEVEGILNNRPITPNPDDNADEEALTPNHLLLMRRGPSPPSGTFNRKDEFTRRWRHCQFIADKFWSRWVQEYLPTIQHRQKWVHPERNFKVGDIVLICDEILPRNQWPLGRVTEIIEGRDGHVRTVTVKTKDSSYQRPVNKLCLLEMS